MINCEDQEDIEPAIALFAKAPALGQVKTRLAVDIGDRAALEFYLAFVSDSLGHLLNLTERPLERYFYLTSKWDTELFPLPDGVQSIPVVYQGILPSLFREGQGIVAQGHLNNQGVFIADEVLAKHDANYKPPLLNNPKPEA